MTPNNTLNIEFSIHAQDFQQIKQQKAEKDPDKLISRKSRHISLVILQISTQPNSSQ